MTDRFASVSLTVPILDNKSRVTAPPKPGTLAFSAELGLVLASDHGDVTIPVTKEELLRMVHDAHVIQIGVGIEMEF